MRDRLEIVWQSIDEKMVPFGFRLMMNEWHISNLMDEIFGRKNFVVYNVMAKEILT